MIYYSLGHINFNFSIKQIYVKPTIDRDAIGSGIEYIANYLPSAVGMIADVFANSPANFIS